MIVLDASALVDIVLDQPSAPWLLDQIDGADVVAPSHQPAEVLSAIGRLVRGDQVDVEAGRAALDEAMALPQRLVQPTAAQVRRAFEWRERIRVLDGLYVVLADEFGAPLVTTDRRLARAAPVCEVRTPP